jgi:O-antigen ligase
MSLSDRVKKNILFVALVAAVVTIPLKNQWNSIAIIFFVAACFIQQPLTGSLKKLRNSWFWAIPALYFAWLALSTFWDVSGGYRLRDIERYLVLLFIPVATAVAPDSIKKFIRAACLAFVAVTVTVCVLCLVKAFNQYSQVHDSRVFYYQYLGEQMGLNAVFLSNYCLASIMWLLYFGFLDRKKRIRRNILIIVLIAFLMFMIFLLSSKLLIFLTVAVMLAFVLVLGYVRAFFKKALLVSIIIFFAGFVAVTQLPYLKWRISSTELKTYEGVQDNQNGVAIRLYMWKTVSGMIAERPLVGYGIHGGRLETLKRYKQDGFEMGVQGDYHSHNQYLESMLMAGIPAIVLLLLMMLTALWYALREKNFLLLLIVVHFMTQSLFESTFEVQHELVFYIFFVFLFFYHAPRHTNADQIQTS